MLLSARMGHDRVIMAANQIQETIGGKWEINEATYFFRTHALDKSPESQPFFPVQCNCLVCCQ